MKTIENIDEWLIDRFEAPLTSDQKMPLHQLLIHSIWFIPRNFVGKWYCGQCGAEGINQVVYSYDIFESDTPMRNFINALRGR